MKNYGLNDSNRLEKANTSLDDESKMSYLYDEGASAYYDWHDWYIIQAILHDYVSLYKSGNIISPRALIDEILSIADSIVNFIPRDIFEKIMKEREKIL